MSKQPKVKTERTETVKYVTLIWVKNCFKEFRNRLQLKKCYLTPNETKKFSILLTYLEDMILEQ